MQVVNLTEQEKQLINNFTFEEFKEYFFNSVVDNENNDSNNNLISIGILSINEYTKYIRNSTCNGSITANNINVWHINTYNSSAYCILVQDTYGGEETVKNQITQSCCEGLPTTHTVIDKTTNNYVRTYYQTCMFELLQNNNQDKIYTNFTHKYIICAYVHSGYNYSSSRMTLKHITIPIVSKSHANNAIVDNVTRSYNSRNITTTLSVSVYGCFRPVFQYKDNQKSNNVYY